MELLRKMSAQALEVIRQGIKSFADRDVELAKSLVELDEPIDEMYKEIWAGSCTPRRKRRHPRNGPHTSPSPAGTSSASPTRSSTWESASTSWLPDTWMANISTTTRTRVLANEQLMATRI